MQSGLEALDPKQHYRAIKEQRKRDFGYSCAYCGCEPSFLTIDHVTPRSQGGTNDPSNLLPACVDCNASKASKASTSLERWYLPPTKNHRYFLQRWLRIVEVLGIE